MKNNQNVCQNLRHKLITLDGIMLETRPGNIVISTLKKINVNVTYSHGAILITNIQEKITQGNGILQ